MTIKILAVDLQNEFATEGGNLYRPRPCVPFIKETLLPFVRQRGYSVAEIISDYRMTPPAIGTGDCVPGQWGYQSIQELYFRGYRAKVLFEEVDTYTGSLEQKRLLCEMRPQVASACQLKASTLDLMLIPQIHVNDSAPWHEDWPTAPISLDPRVAWGLGWGLQLGTLPESFWHWGDNFTYTAFAVGFRHEGIGLVIMTNNGNGYRLFEQICLAAIGGEYPGLWWLQRLFC